MMTLSPKGLAPIYEVKEVLIPPGPSVLNAISVLDESGWAVWFIYI